MKDHSTSSSTSLKEKPTPSSETHSFFVVAVFIVLILGLLIFYVQKTEQIFDEGNPVTDSNTSTSTSENTTPAFNEALGMPYSTGPSGPPENLTQPSFLPPDSK